MQMSKNPPLSALAVPSFLKAEMVWFEVFRLNVTAHKSAVIYQTLKMVCFCLKYEVCSSHL
jgi:hypothetical protein